MTTPLHSDELDVDVPLVRALVTQSRPDWSALPLRRLGASGSTNALFRLGDGLLVRLPRQPGGGADIEKEARWLPQISAALPIPVPEIVAIGEPGLGYPERWSVVRWLDGDTPAAAGAGSERAATAALAVDLAAVVGALARLPVTPEALGDSRLRSYRGEPLRSMDETMRESLEACRTISGLGLDLDAAEDVWEHAINLPESRPRLRWYHGDLFGENLLVGDGRLSGLLDFGCLAIGDPTVDLIVAWEVLDPASRATFRRAVGVDEATWLRGRAWALALALLTFPYYWETMPSRCASKVTVVRSILADAATS